MQVWSRTSSVVGEQSPHRLLEVLIAPHRRQHIPIALTTAWLEWLLLSRGRSLLKFPRNLSLRDLDFFLGVAAAVEVAAVPVGLHAGSWLRAVSPSP
jgi:hypothetical protein